MPSLRETLAEQLKALADPMRLRILELLPADDTCEDVYNVSELARELGITQPSVSHHLLILKRAKIVKCRKMCRDVYYWVDIKHVQSLMSRTERILPKSTVTVGS